MNDYTLTQLKVDIEQMGFPIFELRIKDKVNIKVKPNSYTEHDDYISFWLLNNQKHFFGLFGTIDQYECLRISKKCTMYLTNRSLYHSKLNCMKSINLHDEDYALLGNIYFPAQLCLGF